MNSMNRQIRIVAVISLIMIISLMVSSTIIQSFSAKKLSSNPWNTRSIYEEFGIKRGSITVNKGDTREVIADSVKSADRYNYQRVYQDSPVFSPITGFYSIANKADRGIEAAMNDELNGTSSEAVFKNITDFLFSKEKEGINVNLTISDSAQRAAMEALGDKIGAIVAIEPSTGRILALASTPSIDANLFADHDLDKAAKAYENAVNTSEGDNNSPLINRATSQIYPPGSTFKIVTASAAVEDGVDPDDLVSSPQKYTLPGTETQLPNYTEGSCWRFGPKTALKTVLAYSCNTPFAALGNKLGESKMRDMSKNLGMGTGFLLAGNSKSATPFKANPSSFPQSAKPDRLAMDSIGQGDIAITVLQDALFSCAVANDGKLMTPYLVDSLSDQNGIISKNNPKKFSDAMSSKTAQKMNEMMENAVNTIAPGAKISGVKVSGKSGTAENDPKKDTHAWFSSFAPSNDPKIAVAVFVQNGGFGYSVAGPMAKQVMQAYLSEIGQL